MKVIGIVGGMGAGKTTVVSLIKEFKKCFIISCDQIGHDLLVKGHEGYEKVIEAFGVNILSENGDIVRARLGELVFKNQDKLQLLNGITHPLIYKETKRQIESCKNKNDVSFIIIDAALLIEMGLVSLTDKVIAVYADDEVRINRIISRQRLTRDQVQERFKVQKKWEEFKSIAHEVIDTSSGLEYTKEQIKDLIVRL